MAFPGTYNFNYYRGDTFSFIIRPRDAAGNPFPLNLFTSSAFTIADKRGPTIDSRSASTVIDSVAGTITCTISPSVGRELVTNKIWVYDVQISNTSETFTLLNGNITVTDDVTGAGVPA
jgi:hypothetical protein